MAPEQLPSVGDRVEILRVPLTEASGHAGLVGTFYGFTTPSATGIECVGETDEDLAYNVGFDQGDEWFAPELVAFVDHGAGGTMKVGDREFLRSENGEWIPVPAPDAPRSPDPSGLRGFLARRRGGRTPSN